MVTTKISCLMSALLLTYNSSAHAQDGPARHGFWMDVALGDGLAHLSSDTLAGQNRNGIDFIFDLGWTLSSRVRAGIGVDQWRSEEHTSELQSLAYLVCRLLLEKKKIDSQRLAAVEFSISHICSTSVQGTHV